MIADFKKSDILKKAYKKLKSSVYFDKTNLVLRDKLVQFESSQKNLDSVLDALWNAFLSDDEIWNQYIENIFQDIRCIALPKKLCSGTEKDKASDDATVEQSSGKRPIRKKDPPVILNFDSTQNIEVTELQYFIDMPVEGHILGVLWVLLIGWTLDQKLTHCYGNRIRKRLYNEFSDDVTYSPYLFEPYFENYESWRDSALEMAQEHLKKGDDILILTLDFKRYYYSVDISHDFMKAVLDEFYKSGNNTGLPDPFIYRINEFTYKVIEAYSGRYHEFEGGAGCILPIGFIPSNILANWCLKEFDDAITEGWNPLYYGRYVDDTLIVEKVEKGSWLYDHSRTGELNVSDVIDYYLVKESHWPSPNMVPRSPAVFETDDTKETYTLVRSYMNRLGSNAKITVQNDKAKAYYFDSASNDALIACFREKIDKNKSEFRHMVEDIPIFQPDDYNEIFTLKQEGLNKFRDVDGVVLDRYGLSKYLGKCQRVCGLMSEYQKNSFVKEIKRFFTPHALIENYTLWEKVFTVFIVTEAFDAIESFSKQIASAIQQTNTKSRALTGSLKKNLSAFHDSALARALSLYHFKDTTAFFSEKFRFDIIEPLLPFADKYFSTRMSDKSMCVIWPDVLIHLEGSSASVALNCATSQSVFSFLSGRGTVSLNTLCGVYKYYPYMVTMYDLAIAEQLLDIYGRRGTLKHTLNDLYVETNYCVSAKSKDRYVTEFWFDPQNHKSPFKPIRQTSLTTNKNRAISVDSESLSSLRIALSSIKIADDNFEKLLYGHPNRSRERYKSISRLINEALDQKANMLIMPEACLPIEWLSTLARTCAKNQLAVVTGIEHIIADKKVYNLTAVILPFEDSGYRCAEIAFHSKNHFAPKELHLIEGYGLTPAEGHGYELYHWNDFYFSVYCCYELASIRDRSLVQAYADAIVAVEWNRDVNYYSNIVESLSRDLHCYCIQVNSADYGDSRITKPSRTEEKDILRMKGGEEASVLVATVNIDKLRKFQLKEYELQQDDKDFKATPPQFDRSITEKKIKHELLPNDSGKGVK